MNEKQLEDKKRKEFFEAIAANHPGFNHNNMNFSISKSRNIQPNSGLTLTISLSRAVIPTPGVNLGVNGHYDAVSIVLSIMRREKFITKPYFQEAAEVLERAAGNEWFFDIDDDKYSFITSMSAIGVPTSDYVDFEQLADSVSPIIDEMEQFMLSDKFEEYQEV